MRTLLKRIIAAVLCFLIIFSALPVSASMLEGENDKPVEIDPPPSGISTIVSAAGWALGKIGTVSFNSTISFGVSKLLNLIFPPSSSPDPQLEEINKKLDELSEKMDNIITNQDRTYNKLIELQTFVSNSQYYDIINDFIKFTNSTSFVNHCYSALNNLTADDDQSLADLQISLLTDEIGIDKYEDATALIDQKRSEYYNYMISSYLVEVDGATTSENIFGVYRELMRNTYCWENSAQDQINDFNECIVTNYLFITLVDILSIEARIAVIDKHNADPANASDKWNKSLLNELLKTIIPAETNNVLQLFKEYSVDIPDKYLHFWKGSGDFWFDSTVFSTSKGNEKAPFPTTAFKNGLRPTVTIDSGKNFESTSGFTNRVFQKEFFREICDENKPENSMLVTTEIINTMLSACSNTKTIGEIMAEAGFTNGENIDYLLLNIDDNMNTPGTFQSKITFKFREDIDLECKDYVAFTRHIAADTKNCVAADGADKSCIYCYVDLSDRPELSEKASTVSLYYSDATPPITDCDRLFVYESKDIETCSHTLFTEIHNAEEANCTEEGYTGDVYCLKCGKTVKHGEVIPKSHIPSDTIINAKPASCTEEGYTGDIKCALCNEIAEYGKVIEKLPHDYDFNGTCYACRNCGAVKTPYSKICGDFTVSYYDENADFNYSGGILSIKTESLIEIRNTNPEISTTDTIQIADNTDAHIILAGLNIDASGSEPLSPISVSYNSSADVTVTLKSETENYLYAGRDCAALEKDGVNGSLTVDGTGYLYACGSNNGSAIGSCYDASVSNIIIKSGVITAEKGYNNIGSGKEGSSSNIIIYPTASVKAEKIGCIPVNADGSQVFLNIKDNPDNQPIFIDGVKLPFTNHNEENKVYIYLDNNEHEICFPINGKNGAVIDYENNLIYGIYPLCSVDYFIFTPNSVNYSGGSSLAGTGIKVNIYDSENDYGTYTFILFGDVNGDGVYDGMDSIIVNCIVNGLISKEQVSAPVYMAADCNHDEIIDENDVSLLEQAGVIFAGIDQSKSEESLIEDSVYAEYISLINQNFINQQQSEQSTEENETQNIFRNVLLLLKFIIEKIISFIFRTV